MASLFSILFQGKTEIQQRVDNHRMSQRTINRSEVASAILSADTKRMLIEQKVLELRMKGLELTLQQTENLIQLNLQVDSMGSRRDSLKEQINQTNQRIADISIEIATETLVLVNSDPMNPVFKIAEKIARQPLHRQNELIIQYAEQMNDFMEASGMPSDNFIPREVIQEAKYSAVIYIPIKLATLLGKAIYYVWTFLTSKFVINTVSTAFLVKYGLIPYATYGVCVNVPSYFMYGPLTGLANLILCMGFSGLMIHRSQGIQDVIKIIMNVKDDSVYYTSACSIANIIVESLTDHNYALLTQDIPVLAQGSLSLASAADLFMNFTKSPISTAESIKTSLSNVTDIAKDYIVAFSIIQKATSDLFFKTVQTVATEQIKVAGHNVQNVAETVVEIAAQVGETTVFTALDIAASTGERLKKSVGEIAGKMGQVVGRLRGPNVDHLMIETSQEIKESRKSAVDTLFGWFGYSKDRVDQRADELLELPFDTQLEIPVAQETQQNFYIPDQPVVPLSGPAIGQLNFRCKKVRFSLSRTKSSKSKQSKKTKKSKRQTRKSKK